MVDRVNPRLLKSEPLQRCILGECKAACCLHGVWIDRTEQQDILAHSDLIRPHVSPEWQEPVLWFDGREEADEHTASGMVVHSQVVEMPEHYGGTACVFLRADHKCALQVAAVENGLHPWRFKPFYCILHPLDLDEAGRITLDETDEFLDEPGGCLRSAVECIPLVKTFEPELRYFLGDKGYTALVERAAENQT